MLKRQIVIRISLFILLYIANISDSFSQENIVGKYSSKDGTGEFYINYFFNNEGIFLYNDGGDLGISSYGKGHYFIKNDSLFLNYDLTELKENSYHRTKEYYNSKDSIQVKLNIFNSEKKPLNRIQVWTFPEYKSTESDKFGVALLKFKKEKRKDKIEIHIDGEFLAKHCIYLDFDRNYEIDVLMSKTENYGFGHSKAIKDVIEKYNIIEHTESYIKLKNKSGILIWKKNEI